MFHDILFLVFFPLRCLRICIACTCGFGTTELIIQIDLAIDKTHRTLLDPFTSTDSTFYNHRNLRYFLSLNSLRKKIVIYAHSRSLDLSAESSSTVPECIPRTQPISLNTCAWTRVDDLDSRPPPYCMHGYYWCSSASWCSLSTWVVFLYCQVCGPEEDRTRLCVRTSRLFSIK